MKSIGKPILPNGGFDHYASIGYCRDCVGLRVFCIISRYIDTNPLNTDPTNKYHGTTAQFKAMWSAVAKAVDRSKVKMFWSPVGPFQPGDTIATLNSDWYPGDDVVDLVGLDAVRRLFFIFPSKSSTDFDRC